MTKAASSNCSSWHGVRHGWRSAGPRMQDALTELDNILKDQIAALANAIDDDKADAEAAAIWAA
jgi:hypothetical protein